MFGIGALAFSVMLVLALMAVWMWPRSKPSVQGSGAISSFVPLPSFSQSLQFSVREQTDAEDKAELAAMFVEKRREKHRADLRKEFVELMGD